MKKPTPELGLVDSNILVYLVDNAEPEKHKAALRFLGCISEAPDNYVIALQNLGEYCAVMLKKNRMTSEQMQESFEMFADLFRDILASDFEDVQSASMVSFETGSRFWDTVLAVTMKRNQVPVIYTENLKDFSGFKWLKAVNPIV